MGQQHEFSSPAWEFNQQPTMWRSMRSTLLASPVGRAIQPPKPAAESVPVLAVSFQEALKCIAKVVVSLDVSVEHPQPVGA